MANSSSWTTPDVSHRLSMCGHIKERRDLMLPVATSVYLLKTVEKHSHDYALIT